MYLYLFLFFWILIQLLRTRLSSLSSSSKLQLSISPLSLHLSTSLFNSFPLSVLNWIPHRHSRTNTRRRRLRLYWDVGVILILISFILSQSILFYALCQALRALYTLSIPSSSLTKRAPIPLLPPPDSPQSHRLIKPLIPGFTTNLDGLPTLILALVSSQIIHEFFHSLSAASESLSTESVGFHLFLFLPTFWIKLSPNPRRNSCWTELRIASSGVWANLQLVLIGFVGMGKEVGGLGASEWIMMKGAFERLEEGVKVVHVKKDSPLFELLPPSTLITHLNDLELDSSTSSIKLYDTYLDSNERGGYEEMGWCLSKTLFSPSSNSNSTTSSCSNSTTTSHSLLFTTTTAEEEACLDPLPLLPTSKGPRRCIDQTSCDSSSEGTLVCARIDPREEVMRIRVRDLGDGDEEGGKEERIVIYKGSRSEFFRTVQVTDLTRLYSWIPLSLPLTISRFFSALFTLSLTLGFLNLLPIPLLDGDHILSSFLSCLSSSYNYQRNLSSLPMSREGFEELEQGVLIWVVGRLARMKVGEWIYRNRETIERGLKVSTVVIGSSLAGVTAVVYVGSELLER